MWLFKYPQPHTGQHWTEKVAAEVAAVLGIHHARVELAEFQGHQGSATESFARSGRSLYHGNQVLERVVHGYDPDRRFMQSNHTLGNIFGAVDKILAEPETARALMVNCILLDAVIGTTKMGVCCESVSATRGGDLSLPHSIMPLHWAENSWMTVETGC